METATEERPPLPAERPTRPLALALVLAAIVAGMALVAWGAQESSETSGRLRAAFPDLSDPAWRCRGEEQPAGGYIHTCYPSSGAMGPTVNFLAFPNPETIDATIADAEERHREAERQNHSGFETGMQFLGAEDWAPADGGVWGDVARWRYDNTQAGEVTYCASYRYAGKPFGVTVYAPSLAELADVVAGLRLPAPEELPD